MAKYNFYALETSIEKRICTSWAECEQHRNLAPSGARYKGFVTEDEARAWLNGENLKPNTDTAPGEPESNRENAVAYVDGSYNPNTKIYGYGVVLFIDGRTRTMNGAGTRFAATRNVAGEVEGAITAIEAACENGCKAITIYHDYEGIEAWATERWTAKSPVSIWYQQQLKKLRKYIHINFQKVAAHTGIKYNEEADALAKKAVGV